MSAAEGHHGPPPEPKTPLWLPFLGAALFLLVGLLWGLSLPNEPGDAPHAPAAPGAARGPH